MDRTCFDVIERQAERQWFFRGRAEIVKMMLARRGRGLRVLDLGCGTGHLAAKLAADGYSVVGLEPDAAARAYAAKRIPEVVAGGAEQLPFPDNSFDAVVATDVLEHVADDGRAAAEILRVLRPGGWAILTVPAFRFLWSAQDAKLRHFRRYTRSSMKAVLQGFRIEKLSYFNTILFPAILGARILFRFIPALCRDRDEVEITPAFLNGLFFRFLLIEKFLLRFTNLPVGVSVLVAARKPPQP